MKVDRLLPLIYGTHGGLRGSLKWFRIGEVALAVAFDAVSKAVGIAIEIILEAASEERKEIRVDRKNKRAGRGKEEESSSIHAFSEH